MMKLFGSLLAVITLLALATGCTTSSAEQAKTAIDPLTKDDSVSVYGAVPREQTSQSESTLITREEAKNIALSAVGVTEDNVARLTIELDYDDDMSRWEYEIDFHVGNKEYDMDIDASTGEILRNESEAEPMRAPASSVTKVPTQSATKSSTSAKKELISREETKSLALARAGVSADQVSGYESELDYDDDTRHWKYEISFHVDRVEYELEINAEDGMIICFETDIDD